MGNFLHFKAVEFANATGAFHKATHYCSTSKHVIDYCLGVVRASMMADLCVCACVRVSPCAMGLGSEAVPARVDSGSVCAVLCQAACRGTCAVMMCGSMQRNI